MDIRRTTLPHRALHVGALATIAALTLTGCGGSADQATPDQAPTTASSTAGSTASSTAGDPTPGTTAPTTPIASPTPSEEPAGPTLAVTIDGEEVGPNAEEISLAVGEPLVITFESDRTGELHVHSKPEQYVEFEAGTSEQTIVVETPGEVEVEDHDTGAVLAVLEVS